MNQAPPRTATDVVTDFLVSAPTLEALAAYRLPDDLQERAHALLDKNRAGNLTNEERHEMEEFRQLDHLLVLVKAKAKLKLKSRNE
jgi:hypothetical protein